MSLGKKAQIGVTGLAVMGRNLARNIARHGYVTAVHNRTYARTQSLIEDHGDEGEFVPSTTMEEFVESLERPRTIISMVQAGVATDAVINELVPLLEPGDIIVDAGNAHFPDTVRRELALREAGIHFVGMGVSGGEEGALNGPSIMPGGAPEFYETLGPILEDIAAQVDGVPCTTYVGPDGAGHFVKMVHNGIEYADMQMIADTYFVMKNVLGMTAEEMADTWETWNKGELSSYLVEITARILRKADEMTGKPLVDVILDVAKQKGTGRWTSMSALALGVPAPTITEAVFARTMSSQKEERLVLSKRYRDLAFEGTEVDRPAVLEDLRQALYASKICAYAQGFNLLEEAGKVYGWDLQMGRIAKIWRSGCIIRARFLDTVSEIFEKENGMTNLLASGYFSQILYGARAGWGRIISLAAERGAAVPALSSALAYFDSYRTARGSANLLQAQRDCFGAHTYERIDKEGAFHTDWMN